MLYAEPADKKVKDHLIAAASQDSLASTSKDAEPVSYTHLTLPTNREV